MDIHQINGLAITLDIQGSSEYTKASYPIRYGRFSEIKTPDYIFQFNLNGEIKYIKGLNNTWPDPLEWLKRTAGNDWVYYSTGGYSGVYDAYGEYYLPCPSYPSNAITVGDPFSVHAVTAAVRAWNDLQPSIKASASDISSPKLRMFLNRVSQSDPETLKQRAHKIHDLIGERVTVLPPDSRHVDYNVIPVTVADGCLYKCGFCRVKSRRHFQPRTQEDILFQMRHLKRLYGQDIRNYNAVFLGQHDALNCDPHLLIFAATHAYKTFELEHSNMKGAYLFFFGSVDSLLKTNDTLFESLETLPFLTYINIGLESSDPATLVSIKKAITSERVDEAFARILEINKRYENIEVTANFLFGDNLPGTHLRAFGELMEKRLEHPFGKGALYFSPLVETGMKENRGLIRKFYKTKTKTPLPTYLYLIQRL